MSNAVCWQGKPYRPFHDGVNVRVELPNIYSNSPMTSTKEVLRMFHQLTNPSCLDESVEIHPRPILGHVIPEAVKSKNLPLCHVDNAHWEAGSLCPKSVEVCL
jgi:hypothetical protein